MLTLRKCKKSLDDRCVDTFIDYMFEHITKMEKLIFFLKRDIEKNRQKERDV